MDTEQNNIQLNTFTGGMNSDTSLDMIKSDQYVFGQNIRITKNAQINSDIKARDTEGLLNPVECGKILNSNTIPSGDIMAVASINEIGAIIIKDQDTKKWSVYRVDLDENSITFVKLFTSTQPTDLNKFSVVINKEKEGLTKLYVADGKHPIMEINLYEPIDESEIMGYDVEDTLSSNRLYPTNKVKIANVIGGSLKTSQVQYTYRFYNKNGISSKLAPLTQKIQVIDANRNKEIGNAEDTKTSVGFELSIDINNPFNVVFDHIQLYRLQYIKPGQNANIQLIYDAKISKGETNIIINDTGFDSLQDISIDEFSSISGQTLVPTVIEQNQGYMFAANIEDKSVLRIDLSDFNAPSNVSWRFIFAYIPIHEQIYNVGGAPSSFDQSVLNQMSYLSAGGYRAAAVTVQDYLQSFGIGNDRNITYNELIGSSIFRSLRRDDTYRYGIVLYDKYGTRSDVLWVGDVNTPTMQEAPITTIIGDTLYAIPMGIEFDVTIPQSIVEKYNLISYEIVRCEISDKYQRNLMQCVLSRPVRQRYRQEATDTEQRYSPYYPTCFLSTQSQKIIPGYGDVSDDGTGGNWMPAESSTDGIFQIFSSDIQVAKDDSLSKLSGTQCRLNPVSIVYGDDLSVYNSQIIDKHYISSGAAYTPVVVALDGTLETRRYSFKFDKDDKSGYNYVYNYYNTTGVNYGGSESNIMQVSDVKNPTWEQGFADIQLNGHKIINGIKQYKAYVSSVGNILFNNWISNSMYDLRITEEEAQEGLEEKSYTETIGNGATVNIKTKYTKVFTQIGDEKNVKYCVSRRGWIGPGGQCLLIRTSDSGIISSESSNTIYAHLCNITHTATQYAGVLDTQKQYDIYYGFGNHQLIGNGSQIVFDGNIYITPCEVVTMFKAYDFNSAYDSLMSSQVLYYVPMESVINTFFDYGMNYRNTTSSNLQLKPGDISEIASQDRPLHQYNKIYSDNGISNNVFSAQSIEESDSIFPQRIVYSQRKTNGEQIDSWHIFKAVDFIDADSRYGQVTNLLTNHDMLYYWQNTAFGKLSVNERSLIKDENSNTIQLGQGGVLQRVDYLDVRHGMRSQDYSAIATENDIFWIDILNTAIMLYSQGVVDYGERVNVQNLLNKYTTTDIPEIHYDVQNQELLCKMFGKNQLVFNLKFGIATSIYTRNYKTMLNINNVLYGINEDITQYNYLTGVDKYLTPQVIQFVTNSNSSTTKVFDSQKIVSSKQQYDPKFVQKLLNSSTFSFYTDMYDSSETIEGITDREYNLVYPIPRYSSNGEYGCRMRGKWLSTKIQLDEVDGSFAISHIITKFRQSFS